MSKLLSWNEALEIATKMTSAYGLPSPIFEENNYPGSNSWYIRVYVRRDSLLPVPYAPFLKRLRPVTETEYQVSSLEEALVRLQKELSKFDGRTKLADEFRDRFATDLLDEELRKP